MLPEQKKRSRKEHLHSTCKQPVSLAHTVDLLYQQEGLIKKNMKYTDMAVL